ncbi:MAG: hypothetical protein NWF10_05645 [Candidatus Bathyarchaeota archaeon]|nr:hypothetical protein [Candidatus Bathyarchaeota archaeon]
MKAMIKSKKDYIAYFKELYNRKPSEEELKAFIECMRLKKEKKGYTKNT